MAQPGDRAGRRAPGWARAVVLLAALAAGAACAGRAPVTTGIRDAETAVRVRTALVNDPALGTLAIAVSVRGAVVTLGGTLPSAELVDRAVVLVGGVEGVARVESILVVGDPDPPAAVRRERLPALAPRPDDGPARWIGVGAGVSRAWPGAAGLSPATGVGPLLRLRPRRGLGPTVAFNWTEYRLGTGPGGQPALAALRIRPVMAGLEYGVIRGRMHAAVSIAAGYAFNSLEIDRARTGPGRALDVSNSLVWRPGVSLWYDVTPRVGVRVFGGYLVARPSVAFASDAAVVTRRVSANTALVNIGVAYWVF